jgi:hypothetical protein
MNEYVKFSEREEEFVSLLALGKEVGVAAGKMGYSAGYGERLAEKLRYKLRVRTSKEIPAAYREFTGVDPLARV